MNLQELLGIELPIIQAPMAGVQGSELTIAVSTAGALGSLPCAMLDATTLRRELATIQSASNKPFNANFFCHQPTEPDSDREVQWRKTLSPYFDELGIDPDTIAAPVSREPFSRKTLEVLEDFKPAVISFHFGLPDKDLLSVVKRWGSKVLCSATTREEAQWLQAQGVDAVIAQGLEAGGHRGSFLSDDMSRQSTTFALLAQMIQDLNIPVIAAGGIADAKGVAAAMTLGAAGVQIGTSYLLCPEAKTSALHRAALIDERSEHTALTNVFTGRPARAIVNRLIEEIGPFNSTAPQFPSAATAVGALRSTAEAQENSDFSSMWCGQNASGCQAIPAAELTRLLAKDLPVNEE